MTTETSAFMVAGIVIVIEAMVGTVDNKWGRGASTRRRPKSLSGDEAFVRTRLVSRSTIGINLGNARAIWQETSDYSTVG